MLSFDAQSPEQIAAQLADRVRARRLERTWSREELGKRSGVAPATLRKFEDTGRISLDRLLRLLAALDALDQVERLLAPATPTRSLDSFAAFDATVTRQRGRTVRRNDSPVIPRPDPSKDPSSAHNTPTSLGPDGVVSGGGGTPLGRARRRRRT